MAHTLFELDVRLREIEPPIWRTIEIPGAWTLADVHQAIQVAMGWTNSHLHQFKIGDKRYGMADAEDAGELDLEDESRCRLQDLVTEGTSFLYEYDFGDGWEHDVTVTKISTVTKPPRPRCTAGARACPPEDCGGYGGYAQLLRAIADPHDENHEDMLSWAGEFEPERFAVPRTGRDLRNEMEMLKGLADGGDEFEAEFDLEDDELAGLPHPLVDAVLALEPVQRAALAAVIAGSLAQEVTELRSIAAPPAPRKRQQRRKPAPRRRRRSRS